MGAEQDTYRRRYITLVTGLVLCAMPGGTGAAQERVVQRHAFSEQEGRLMAFYSATMAFTPAGLAPDESRLWFGIEVSHVPRLNEAQRRPSIDKPEATNLAPFFPRPRAGLRLGPWRVEASWIPPLQVFDIRANLASLSLSAPGVRVARTTIVPRAWLTTGRVRGAMTCSATELLGRGPDLEQYFTSVCHGQESDDWFEPRLVAAELIAAGTIGRGPDLYLLAGGRVDRTRFDIGVRMADGTRDPDHPVLALRATRPHLAAGATWRVRGTGAAGLELFYAPGSVLTARVSARWTVRR